ncbi:MAG: hypothetical protein JST15_03960 [Bacteroidetes bacterium]|nr:hypothetical protein [Bacteroidota bacterium]
MKSVYFTKNKILIALILISLSLSGSDCEKLIQNNEVIPQDLAGNWKLSEQTGALQDICPNETVNFQLNGVAQLTCPNSQTISRYYTVQDNSLKYTQTSVSYKIQTLNNDTLYLLGQNVSRNLIYLKISADEMNVPGSTKNDSFNSSEIKAKENFNEN